MGEEAANSGVTGFSPTHRASATMPFTLHGRPAHYISQLANTFPCSVLLAGSSATVSCKDLFSLMKAQIAGGEVIEIIAWGERSEVAVAAIKELVETGCGMPKGANNVADYVSDKPSGHDDASAFGSASFLDIVKPANVLVPLHADSPEDAFGELVAAVAHELPPGAESHVVLDLLGREFESTFSFGRGIVAPHLYITGLHRFVASMGISPTGIAWPTARDTVHARAFFLILAPPQTHETKERILANLAEMLSDGDARRRLFDAKTMGAALDVLRAVQQS